jgi:single-strand DNA-binding protein
MKGNNTVQLIGYVGNHLRILQRPSGKKIILRVATHDRYKNSAGEQKVNTVWHEVAAWNEVGQMAENSFVKGSHILVQGRLLHRTYLDQSGHVRYVTEIAADHLENLDR